MTVHKAARLPDMGNCRPCFTPFPDLVAMHFCFADSPGVQPRPNPPTYRSVAGLSAPVAVGSLTAHN